MVGLRPWRSAVRGAAGPGRSGHSGALRTSLPHRRSHAQHTEGDLHDTAPHATVSNQIEPATLATQPRRAGMRRSFGNSSFVLVLDRLLTDVRERGRRRGRSCLRLLLGCGEACVRGSYPSPGSGLCTPDFGLWIPDSGFSTSDSLNDTPDRAAISSRWSTTMVPVRRRLARVLRDWWLA